MNSGPSGFYNAPVTKAIVVSSAVLSLLATSRGGPLLLNLSYDAVVRRGQLWRSLTCCHVFQSSPEAVFGLYLLYFFRIFERQNGSNKFAVFVVFTNVIATLLQLAALFTLRGADGRLALSPGPYALIFALMVPFCFDVPVSTRFTIFSLKLSDKSFVYLAGLQMLLSAGKSSIIPGAAGILAGFLYRSNVLHVRSLKFPDALAESAARLFAPLMSRPPAAPATRPGGARAAVDPGHHRVPAAAQGGQGFQERLVGGPPAPGNRYAPSAPPLAPPLPPPSEADVATLEAMGFDREAALRALSQARGDLNLATNLLLESQIM